MEYFNIAEEIYNRTSPGSGKAPSDWFKDNLKTYIGRANRRKGRVSYEDMVKRLKKSKSGVFSDEVKKKFGTIYTPEFVVDKTLDLAFKYLPEGVDPLTLTWCDPAVGDGNFLINLYDRLMKCPSQMEPILQSEHILMNCLYGVEILKNMVFSCKIRLTMAHFETIRKHDDMKRGYCDIMEKLNIYHGNAIMVPEDIGKWEIEPKQEGGLLDEETRNKKYDVVIGNPPYTHLRNLENRRYHAYPKQRDMAQVFVRWALDHGNVISYNITDTWLNAKISDGAKETRKLVDGKIREIVQDTNIMRYSEKEGGNIGTMVICISEITSNKLTINEKEHNKNDVTNIKFIESFKEINLQYKYCCITKYTDKLKGHRSSCKHHNKFNQLIEEEGSFYVMSKCVVGLQSARDWMIIKSNDIINIIENNINSEAKYFDVDENHAKWLFGFLNSNHGVDMVKNTFRDGGKSSTWVKLLSNNMFQTMKVPDFDYYKENHPKQFNSYMKWIELNMRDKDKFLEGIDEQFEKLIGEK